MKRILCFILILSVGVAIGRNLDQVAVEAEGGQGVAENCATENGDVNGDRNIDITDAINILGNLFLGTPELVSICDAQQPTEMATVVLVRHGEKESTGADPGLTPEGQARAERLAAIFRNADVAHLIASTYRRTQETLAPLAELKGVELELVMDSEAVADRIRELPSGSLTVIAHHSFTIPGILSYLGVEIPEGVIVSGDSFDNFLMLFVGGGGAPRLLPMTYY